MLDRTGTLEPGKLGDVVVWNGTPFSIYAQAEQVYIDGARVYDRKRSGRQPRSDFLLGQSAARDGRRAMNRRLATLTAALLRSRTVPAGAGMRRTLLIRNATVHTGTGARHAAGHRRAGARRAHRRRRPRPRRAGTACRRWTRMARR